VIAALPTPDAADSVIQETGLVTVHEQPLGMVIVRPSGPPDPGTVRARGETTASQLVAAAWFTVTDWPATVTDPLRPAFVFVFAATEKPTLPEPVPVVLVIGVNQLGDESSVHAQPDVVVTVIVTVPPAAETGALGAVTMNWHAAPSCAIGTTESLIFTFPCRLLRDALAETTT
jgi:hypothetical protein